MSFEEKKHSPFRRSDWLVLALLVGLAWWLVFLPTGADGRLHVFFLDVGQGDAIFIQTPEGEQILVDGGPDQTILRRLGEVMPFYDQSIDLVVSTHGDADHLAGLIDVLNHYQVQHILETGVVCPTAWCQEWDRLKKIEGAEMAIAALGEEITVGKSVKLIVLNPFENLSGQELAKRNNAGIVLKLIFGQQTVLLTADIESLVENKFLLSGVNLQSEFLKVAHHGSKTSSTEDFLKAVHPQAAFIEVGKHNPYGHPAPEILTRLANLNIPYYRTDINGTIELVMDGQNYKITSK